MTSPSLKVKSHVGRDLLQSAQLFRHEHSVIWEYVANGLEYRDLGTTPTVVVTIDPKGRKAQVRDNGSGMLMEDLSHYFKMHGENLQRKQGKPGRGFFGTGKSAAFGIANSLTITTVKNKRRSKVRLTRKDIEGHPDGTEIPVTVLESEAKVDAPNGTLIEIGEIFVKSIDIASIIRHIERHIAFWPDASVFVNNHECEFSEPDVERELTFKTKGTEYEQTLGDRTLVIKVAKAPLEPDLRGIAILADNVWHETTLAGCERKPFSEYLFGTFNVPILGNDASGIPAFDMSRSMKLNPRNETVAEILRFVGVNLEIVRKELELRDRERRQSEEQRRFQKQASKIADLINSHFDKWSAKLRNTMSKAGVGKDLLSAVDQSNAAGPKIISGDELLAAFLNSEGGTSPAAEPDSDPFPDAIPSRVKPSPDASKPRGKQSNSKDPKTRAGGFHVDFRNLGLNEKRAKYDREHREILINLEHPLIVLAAKEAGPLPQADNPNFLRLAYEIAFTEYAIVLAQELSAVQYFFDPQDALVDLRQTIDDLSKNFALAQL